MVNYNDIARIASVSPTTVSHVINKTRFVSPETKKRVTNAMKKVGYKPNLLARGLATGKTHTLGLVLSDIRNPFYPALVRGVEDEAIKNKYNTFLCNTDFDIEKGFASIDALVGKKVDGIIIASSQADYSFFKELEKAGTPFVIIDCNVDNIKADGIYFNFNIGMEEAVKHLVDLGHKKIFFISGPNNLNTAVVRKNIFIDMVKKYNGSILYKIFEGSHKMKGGEEAVKKILKEEILPTAIMCSNDLSAIGAMKLFRRNNIKIPDDVSIIGLDNINLTEIVSPPLSTIEIDKYSIGQYAAKALFNRLNNKDIPKQKEVFNTKFIKRGSTAPPRKIT